MTGQAGCLPGRVYLVGAGPGPADLLTLRAARLLADAQLVVHDQLVPHELLAAACPDAQHLPVGRRSGRVVLDHDQVVEVLASAAGSGRRVVRLKGGDPVVFGRGGEEALDLAARGIPTQLVPGVTSAVAAPELAGIPVTHRGLAAGLLVLTGHRADGPGLRPGDAQLAARFDGTVVVLMAARWVARLCAELVRHGRPAGTPAALVAHAGHHDQRSVVSDLAGLPAAVEDAEVTAPAVLVVGEVVSVAAHHGERPDVAPCALRSTRTGPT